MRAGPAPSIWAALTRSGSTERKPARKSAIAKPEDCQTPVAMIAIDRGVLARGEAEGEIVPTETAHEEFDAGVGAIEPAPDRARDHERHRERIEKDRPPEGFAFHTLIDRDGQREADGEGQDHIEGAEEEEVAVGDRPSLVRPQLEIGLETDEPVSRQQRAVRHRDIQRPRRENEDIDEARHDGRRDDDAAASSRPAHRAPERVDRCPRSR